MPYCPRCGSRMSDGDRYCQVCGADTGGPSPPRAPKRNTWIPVVLVVGIILCATVGFAILIFSAEPSDMRRTYSWEYEGERFTYSMTVSNQDYRAMMASTIDRGGTVSTDRYVSYGETVFGVSDYIVVDGYITKVAADLRQMHTDRYGGCTDDQFVAFAAAFVQDSIAYDQAEADSGGEYWRFPLETLCDRRGDCEDTSILLAAILDAGGLDAGIVLLPGHAMCAVDRSCLSGTYDNEKWSSLFGIHFYPIETTAHHNIGWVHSDYTSVYFHLYMGSVTGYFTP